MVPRMPTTTLTTPINIHSSFIHDDSRPTGGRSDANSRRGDREYQTLGVGCQGTEGGSAEGSAIAWIQIFVDKLLFAISSGYKHKTPGLWSKTTAEQLSIWFSRIFHSDVHSLPQDTYIARINFRKLFDCSTRQP